MALQVILTALSVATFASAHFSIEYPVWRGDSLKNTSYSQWNYPCAGVAPTSNRTAWPLTGGSLKLDLHHPWTYIYVNLGLGSNATNFNYTLTAQPLNETGNGTLCISHLPIAANLFAATSDSTGASVVDGTEASLQIVTSGESGSALYNCADIVFRQNATVLGTNECVTTPGLTYVVVGEQNRTTATNGSATSNTTTAAGGSTTTATSDAGSLGLSGVEGLAAIVGVMGMLLLV